MSAPDLCRALSRVEAARVLVRMAQMVRDDSEGLSPRDSSLVTDVVCGLLDDAVDELVAADPFGARDAEIERRTEAAQ